MKAAMLVGLVVMVTPLVAVAEEQSTATHGASPVSQEGLRMRYEVRVMERVLEQAVQHGAQVVGQQLQSLIPMMLFTTPARARGFRLDGYGVFFDVEIPPIRRSMAWSFQTLDQLDLGVNSALQALRQHVQSLGNPSRGDLEQALQRLEVQIRPTSVGAALGARAAGIDDRRRAPGRSADGAAPIVAAKDPVEVYADEVKRAIIDAMLNHSRSLGIGSEEWLTVAARDNEAWLTPSDLSAALTMTLRIRGRDLAAFVDGELTREATSERVEVQEF